MTFDWVDYLTLAKIPREDANNPNSLREARLRSAISRAYYSAFNMAKDYLISLGNRFSGSAEVHREIQNIFEHLSENERDDNKRRNLVEISNELGVLRSSRNKADYDKIVLRIDKMAEAALIRAGRVYELIKSL